MNTALASRFAQALRKQQALTDSEWLGRCDELAQQQRVMFLELVTFARDGASEAHFRALMDYLSCLQFLAADEPGSISAPVEVAEFRDAVERATLFFRSLGTDDRRHLERMTRAWCEGAASQSEPVVWACCIETLRQNDILSSPLGKGMVVTLYAIAEVYSRRFGARTASSVAAK